jgi:Domain of unknown function (DUF4157)
MRTHRQHASQPEHTKLSRSGRGSGEVFPARASHPLLRVQNLFGNQALQRQIRRNLTLDTNGSREQEAGHVADAVMNNIRPSLSQPAGKQLLQRACSCGGLCNRYQAHSSVGESNATAMPRVEQALNGPSQPLEPSVQTFMQNRFGDDFSNVRVHTDTRAAESAKAVGALAYTVGDDVVFSPGKYSPSSRPGQKLLAHELAHTVQQRQSGNATVQRYKVTDCDPKDNPLELPSTVHDAHHRAVAMLNNAIAKSASPADPAVQAAALKHFKISLPPATPDAQKVWNKILNAMTTMKRADANAVYECEPKQNWWNGGCIKGNIAISLFNIHLCPLWWQLFSSVDCRARVLVHEWGHKWGKGVNRIFETYDFQTKKYGGLPASERAKMPDAYADYAYELAGNSKAC